MSSIQKSYLEHVRTAFTLGFLISCDGFNGECTYDHLAPTSLPDQATADEFIRHEKELNKLELGNPKFLVLLEEAVHLLTGYKPIDSILRLTTEPFAIEYIKADNSSYVHTFGTAFYRNSAWDLDSLKSYDIVGYRIRHDLDYLAV